MTKNTFEQYCDMRFDSVAGCLNDQEPKLWQKRGFGIFIIAAWEIDGILNCLPYLSKEDYWREFECGKDTVHHFGLQANMEDDVNQTLGTIPTVAEVGVDGYKGYVRGFTTILPRCQKPLRTTFAFDMFHFPDDVTHNFITQPNEREDAIARLRQAVDVMAAALSKESQKVKPVYNGKWR
ncbi:MAG: hypothetical protein WBP14_04165 [Candidatus Saccharimonas aalborgensis]